VPEAPPHQTGQRLEPHPARTRRPDLGHPARPKLHRHPRPLPGL